MKKSIAFVLISGFLAMLTSAFADDQKPAKFLIHKFTLQAGSTTPPSFVINLSPQAKYVTCWARSVWQCTQDVNMSWSMQVGHTKTQSHTYPGRCNEDDPTKYGPITSSITMPVKDADKVTVNLITYHQSSVGAINFECWGHDKKLAF